MRPITLEAQKFDAHCNTGSSLHSRLHGPSVGTVSTPQTGSDSYETTTKASAGAVGLMGLFISMTKLGKGLGLQRVFVCPPCPPLSCLSVVVVVVGWVCLSLSHSLPMSLSANFHLRLDGNLCQLEMAICASSRDPASGCRSRAWSAGAWNHFLVACAAEYALCLIVAELRKLADAHNKNIQNKACTVWNLFLSHACRIVLRYFRPAELPII